MSNACDFFLLINKIIASPPGNDFLVDEESNFIVDEDGNYLTDEL